MPSASVPCPAPDNVAAFELNLRSLLRAYSDQPGDERLLEELGAMRRTMACFVANLPAVQGREHVLELVRPWLKLWAGSGLDDRPVNAADLAAANAYVKVNGRGLLAAMLLVPAWQWPAVPSLAEVPAWLWEDFTRHVFYTPQGFCAVGDADAYGAHYLRRLEELTALVAANRSPAETLAAVNAYLAGANCIPLYFSAGTLRRHYELRGRLLSLALGGATQPKLPARDRSGRRLRVGFINQHFGPQTETFTTLPMFEQLDPARFEVRLFTLHETGTPLETYARGCTAGFTVLPAGIPAQLAALRAAELDIVVFGTNVTAVINPITQLALHRVAPLQVVNNSSCTTTGLPEIDLYVSGTLTETATAAAGFTERLGLLPGPAHAFNYEADQAAPTQAPTRAALGLPDDAVVFVSAANYFKVIPEMRAAWARLLAAVPGSRLLLHPFNPNWSSSYPIKRFRAEFDAVLANHGVAADRLVLSTTRFPSRTDVRELLRVGDIYLDTFPFGGVNSLVDPLEAGLPVVAWEGETFRSRMGAALLRVLGLEELTARDADSYHDLCVGLAADSVRRTELRQRIVERMARLPVFLDALAASDAFGALLEKAHEEVFTRGRAAFRREPKPLYGPEVASPALRQERGRTLLAAGRADRATMYFLTAIQGDERSASLWHDLAQALHQTGRTEDSVAALQSCLRLDARYLDGWLLLGELALVAGHQSLLADAVAMTREIGPTNARVADLAERAGLPAASDSGKRILVYTDDSQFGGVAMYNDSLMTGLMSAGYVVSCAQSRSDSPLVARQRALGVMHHWIAYDTKTEFMKTMEDVAGARRLLVAARPDLIVFSDCCPVSNLAARDAAIELGIPYVVVVGFVGAYLADRFSGVLGRLAAQYARAGAVVAVSQENLSVLQSRFGLGQHAGRVIHYGRPENYFTPTDPARRTKLRAELGLPGDAIVCFTAARLTAVKGFLYQLAAAKRLAQQPGGDRVHFVWAGEGEQRAELERAIASAGLGGRVHLLGHRWDVADWYDAADIFVLPSELEGMPLAIMEAMGKGLAVAATAVSGIPEELGETGWLLPDPKVDPQQTMAELTRALSAWVRDPELRLKAGRQCHERAQHYFREELMLRRTLELITDCLRPATGALEDESTAAVIPVHYAAAV